MRHEKTEEETQKGRRVFNIVSYYEYINARVVRFTTSD